MKITLEKYDNYILTNFKNDKFRYFLMMLPKNIICVAFLGIIIFLNCIVFK